MYQGFALSVRGYSHIKENIVRQDSAMYYSDPAGWAMTAVADGHGGEDYFRSHIGSRFAVESAFAAVRNCLSEQEAFITALRTDPEAIFHRLDRALLSAWSQLSWNLTQLPKRSTGDD